MGIDPTSILTSLATQAIGSLGSSAINSKNQSQLTPGVSPEQAALAQYQYGQNLLKDRAQFANTGTGTSTMATQAAGGSRMGEALKTAQQSDANLAQQFSQLQQLASNAGFNAGSQGGGTGGGTTPSTTTSSDTSTSGSFNTTPGTLTV